jgi:formyltetrahydrofolate deformylase
MCTDKMTQKENTTARLLITCPDKPGIVSSVSTFLYNHGANIIDLDQHSTETTEDAECDTYFMRLEFQTPSLEISCDTLERTFAQAVASRYDMDWKLSYAKDRKKIAILVSRVDHALLELLWRWQRGALSCDIVAVISNHEDLRASVERFQVPFHVVPVTRDNKVEAEAKIQSLLASCDLVVLARYMQILSADFVEKWPHKIINIHHSFLPAFVGADPYRQAYEKGVKLIGATAHYVTADLDQGPIIEQDVQRVSHRDSVDSLRELGRDVERDVLAKAVKWHLEDRIIVHGNKTIVFS